MSSQHTSRGGGGGGGICVRSASSLLTSRFHQRRLQCTHICKCKNPKSDRDNDDNNATTSTTNDEQTDDDPLTTFLQALPTYALVEGAVDAIADGNAARRAVRALADLRLAIAELFALSALSALGTAVTQNQAPDFYEMKYPSYQLLMPTFLPEETRQSAADALDAVLPSPGGVAVLLGFDHMFISPVFLACGVGLAASLAACTYTRQIPMVKVARRWRYITSSARFASLDASSRMQAPEAHGRARSIAKELATRGYRVFFDAASAGDEAKAYAFKGLSGRLGPIGVHASLLLILFGASYGALASWKGNVFLPGGTDVMVSEVMRPAGVLSTSFPALDSRLRVDDFRIAYTPDGKVDQFYADVALDMPGSEAPEPATTISVNAPLRGRGLTVYQGEWKVAAVRVQARPVTPPLNEETGVQPAPAAWREIALPMAPLRSGGGAAGGERYGAFVPLDDDDVGASAAARRGGALYGASLVARDLQQVAIYGPDGNFVGVRRPGSNKPIVVGGTEIIVNELRGAAGLDLKVDPGVPYVYAGFAGLLVTVFVSYVSHSQIWLWQDGDELFVGGTSNRAKLALLKELEEVLALTNAAGVTAKETATTTTVMK